MSKIALSIFLTVSFCILSGCGEAPAPAFRLNEVEFLKQEKLALPDGEHFSAEYRQEIESILTALFGTPEDPKFPFLDENSTDGDSTSFINLENLQWAAGRVHSDIEGRPISGLYREHCAHCHGISGDGAGPSAAFLNPYPRDFRHAKFKFKSTPLRQAPTDDDLKQILIRGIPGTAMPSFQTLPEEEIEALVDYVKYLSIRGHYERLLISELSSLQGEPLFKIPEGSKKQFSELLLAGDEEPSGSADYLIGELLQDGSMDRWKSPDDSVTEVPPAPPAVEANHPDHKSLVDQGREIYFAKGNCAQCHGDTAMGDAQLINYDDWTNDWIKSAGVDPTIRDTYRDFKAAGALKPRPIRPRNLRMPFYRGGGSPQALYRRILNGIEGTPMPAGATLKEDEIWALVAYVKWLPTEKVNAPDDKVSN